MESHIFCHAMGQKYLFTCLNIFFTFLVYQGLYQPNYIFLLETEVRRFVIPLYVVIHAQRSKFSSIDVGNN